MLYINYGSNKRRTLEDFARERHLMFAPRLGGGADVALDYTYSVFDEGGVRNPTVAEKAEVAGAIWNYRERFLDCRNECQLRMRLDDVWRCMSCRAVWNDAEGGRSFGVPLSTQLAFKMTHVQRDKAREVSDEELYATAVDALADQRNTLAGLHAYAKAHGNDASGPVLLMDTQVTGIYARFLLVQGYEGRLAASWYTARQFAALLSGKNVQDVRI